MSLQVPQVSRERGVLPNLIVIGGMKCGTSSLHSYLRRHPQISMSAEKELDFFIEDRQWRQGTEWYGSQFRDTKVRGEASPNYTARDRFPGVPERMHSVIPDARLIYLVRDPIERVISHWVHLYSGDGEIPPIDEAIRSIIYVGRSQYWRQLCAFLEYYPPDRILVVDSDDLRHRRSEAMQRIFRFLGVDPEFSSPLYRLERHRSSFLRKKTRLGERLASTGLEGRLDRLPRPWGWGAKRLTFLPFSRAIPRPRLSDPAREWLADQVRDDVAQLRAFTGLSLKGWSV
ncbi:MAG: sulfotransferase family protein [Gemmatimonadota bacterium]